jgi:glucose/mannose-6-phosphate isomerase
MADLDSMEIYRRYDPDGMRQHLLNLPQQCLAAWEDASAFILPDDFTQVNKVVVCGMGGSAIGGDLLRSLTSTISHPLIFIHRDYDLPPFVDDKTLVIASSYSGNTEETLSAFEQALKINCKKLAVTTGGRLGEIAQRNGIPIFSLNYTSQPRAALGYSFIPLIAFLCHLGLMEDKSSDLRETALLMESLSEKLSHEMITLHNPAKQIAGKLPGKLVLIYGGGVLTPVARRWKGQFNENSKNWASFEAFSELNHNAVVGYEFPRELANMVYVIMLRSSWLHPRLLARYRITGEILQGAGIEYETIDGQGKNMLAQMMSLVLLGDWTSYYLAMLNETDPTPVNVITYLKTRLSQLS